MQKKRNGYVNLNSADCQTLYGMSYKQIVFEPLKELGIIEVYDGYVPGVRSKGYRLTKPYRIEVEKGGLKELEVAPARGRADAERRRAVARNQFVFF